MIVQRDVLARRLRGEEAVEVEDLHDRLDVRHLDEHVALAERPQEPQHVLADLERSESGPDPEKRRRSELAPEAGGPVLQESTSHLQEFVRRGRFRGRTPTAETWSSQTGSHTGGE